MTTKLKRVNNISATVYAHLHRFTRPTNRQYRHDRTVAIAVTWPWTAHESRVCILVMGRDRYSTRHWLEELWKTAA